MPASALRTVADAVNVGRRLSDTARTMPAGIAVVVPCRRTAAGWQYDRHTFRELDDDSDALARGLLRLGVVPGTRLALLVRPSYRFVALVFALFKSAAVQILIDPGMGRRNLLKCLDEVEPQGFVAVSPVQAVRTLLRRRYATVKLNVTVGRRWFWHGETYESLLRLGRDELPLPATLRDDPAAIIFTTGSTGPPKGVLYRHGNFDRQVDEIRDAYGIRPGEVDVSCFPLFALFNCAMGVTTVLPRMDFTRPAAADPRNVLAAINDNRATQSFGSPAVWKSVGLHCERTGERLPTLRRVLSAGAPVHAPVLRRMRACLPPDATVHTPYGATEALPVASIESSEVLNETAARTDAGGGVCVGRRFPGIEWKVLRIVDAPIETMADAEELPAGEIGELVVRGPAVTGEYVGRPRANALGKIADGKTVWHRLGDAGYLDEQGRFWFCGRVAHRVTTLAGTMFTIPCEAIFNVHAAVNRTALVGVGPPGQQRPVMIAEPNEDQKSWRSNPPWAPALLADLLRLGAANPLTAGIRDFLFHPAFPVDIRHNAKIFREKLAVWAARRLDC